MTRMYKVDPHKPSTTVHFDWLTAVLPVPETESARGGLNVAEWAFQALSMLGFSYRFEPMKRGLYTYPHAASAAGASIIVAWPEEPDNDNHSCSNQTVMIQLSGTGIESLESTYFNQGRVIADFVKDVITTFDGSFSRVDACANFFNFDYHYSARYVGEEALDGRLVTRSSRMRLVRSCSTKGGRDSLSAYTGPEEGYTLYVGTSPKQLRIYNKAAERSYKVNQRFAVDSWSRWEFELNGVASSDFIRAYVERNYDLVVTWVDWLANNYRWIDDSKGNQTKRSRYPNADWYQLIVDDANDLMTVRAEQQKPTLEHAEKWINHQVSRTLGTMYMARLTAYERNGVSEMDAKKLAVEYILRQFEDTVLDRTIDETLVSAYANENLKRGLL